MRARCRLHPVGSRSAACAEAALPAEMNVTLPVPQCRDVQHPGDCEGGLAGLAWSGGRPSVAGGVTRAAGTGGRLRGELTEFGGRRAELARVRDALEGARLVTLTGPGGIGKTRLALQVAAGAGRAFRDGVWLTELSGLRDPGLLVGEVARSLGLSDRSARWAVASLADYLENRQLLLVLDGCEHLADACALMADALLRGCPGLRIIATSRHVLGVAGEVTTAIPPMTVQ